MDQIHSVIGQRTARQAFQVFAIFRKQGVAGPQRGGLRRGIEILHGLKGGGLGLGADPVVIAADDDRHIFAGPLHNRVGVRAVTHQIAQAQDAVVAPARVIEHGLMRFQVRVNVAQDQIRHKRTSATSGGAPMRAGMAMVPIPRETKMEAGPWR